MRECVFLIFDDFLEGFVMLVSEDICLIFLIISENTNYEFSKAIFTELWKFWCEVSTVVLECMHIQNDDRF